MSESYLDRCLGMFDDTMQERYGWRPDYGGLEAALAPIGAGRRDLTYRDLETIQNGRYWDFRQFWRFPAQSDIVAELDDPAITRLIVRLPLDEAPTIARLHAAFKSIENVSVLLRFLNPSHYGIMSPPVEKVLEVRRGRTEVETYLNYLRDLRAIRDHYGLARAADADMALWVLQERVLLSYRDPDLLRSFRADTWMLRRRAVNLLADLGELAGEASLLDLARALAGAHGTLAVVLAGHELEARLRARLASLGVDAAAPDLGEVIQRLSGLLDERTAARLMGAARSVRCFLAGGVRPTTAETLEMIDLAEQIAGAPG